MAHAQGLSKWQQNFGTPLQEFRAAVRVNGSWLAKGERKVLVWMARHLPGAINSDHLTALALLSMAASGAAYSYSGRHLWALWLVNLCLVLNWLGDSLDGTLARERKLQRSRYGFYVDHMCDGFSAVFLLGGLAFSGYMQPAIAAALLIAYLLLSIESYLATYTTGIFRISQFKFGPTELRIVLAVGNAWLFAHPRAGARLFGHNIPLFDCGGLIAATLMTGVLLFAAGRNLRTLYREERRW